MSLRKRFNEAVESLKRFEEYDDYLGAFVFGSYARGQIDIHSDLDVKIIVKQTNTCSAVNHPYLKGIKLDLSFLSFSELLDETNADIKKGARIPMIAESVIIFDKTGHLNSLKTSVSKVKPKKLTPNDLNWIQFMIYHASDKAKRNLDSDPMSSLLALDSNLQEILKFHYQINRRWWLSNKRLLQDIRRWDPSLYQILENFLTTIDVHRKYCLWESITNHILNQIGGKRLLKDINCSCKSCSKHLQVIQNS